MGYRILLYEPDGMLNSLLNFHFTKKGHIMVWTQSIGEVYLMIKQQSIDIILMVLTQNSQQELEFFKQIKEYSQFPPYIVIAQDIEEEMVLMGADYVLGKPFDYNQLDTSIIATLSRINEHRLILDYHNSMEEVYRFGLLTVYPKRLEIQFEDHWIQLRKEEFRLTFHFLKYPGETFSNHQLYEIIFMKSSNNTKRVLNIISSLRRKLHITNSYIQIQSVKSLGYKLIIELQ